MLRAVSYICLFFLLSVCFVQADDHSHEYKDGEEVTLWLNKVGPYHNPQETYAYSSLPYCTSTIKKETRSVSHSLGVILEGDTLTDSGLLIKFKEPLSKDQGHICDLALTDDAVLHRFLGAVKQHYWYQMYIDELPLWGMVGEYMTAEAQDNAGQTVVQEQGFLYTHKAFSISYNGDRVIEVNLTSEDPRPLVKGQTYPLTYSVSWSATNAPYETRFEKYLDFDFFEHQIHWFSIFNSFMMVIFLCGLVALILIRTLKNDYARYTKDELDHAEAGDGDDDDPSLDLERLVDESGWKQVHGDVFRPPKYLMLFCAMYGTGFQLFILLFLILILALIGTVYYDERGYLTSALLTCYTLTSSVAGYMGGQMYKRYNGNKWKECMVLTAILLPGLCFLIGSSVNVVAVWYQSYTAISFGTMVLIFLIWSFISCPLILLGTILGRSTVQPLDFPCRVNALQRPIPEKKSYNSPLLLGLFAGILPFGSIFIELYFIFSSFWQYKTFYLYELSFLVLIIFLLVTMCVTIVVTYVLLHSEDWRWVWSAFWSGASSSVYVYLYSIYYFHTKTHMSGFLQTFYYFGYMLMFAIIVALIGGSIGALGASIFVRRIYSYIKSD